MTKSSDHLLKSLIQSLIHRTVPASSLLVFITCHCAPMPTCPSASVDCLISLATLVDLASGGCEEGPDCFFLFRLVTNSCYWATCNVVSSAITKRACFFSRNASLGTRCFGSSLLITNFSSLAASRVTLRSSWSKFKFWVVFCRALFIHGSNLSI